MGVRRTRCDVEDVRDGRRYLSVDNTDSAPRRSIKAARVAAIAADYVNAPAVGRVGAEHVFNATDPFTWQPDFDLKTTKQPHLPSKLTLNSFEYRAVNQLFPFKNEKQTFS